MAFTYRAYEPTTTSDVASILGLQGQIAAQAELRRAAAVRENANQHIARTGQTGAIIANAAQGVASNVGDILELKRQAPIKALQVRDLQNRVTAGELDTKQKQVSAERAVHLRKTLGEAIAANTTPEGVNHTGVIDYLQKHDAVDVVDDYVDLATKEDKLANPAPTIVAPGASAINRKGETVFTAPSRPVAPTRATLAVDAANPNSPTRKQSADALAAMDAAPKAGSFEDYVKKVATERGVTVDKLTVKDIEAARKAYGQADDRAINISGMGGLYGQIDPKAIADEIEAGRQSPIITDLGRPTGAAVQSILGKRGFNMLQAQMNWKAETKHLQSLNSTQQLRLRQATETAYHSLDIIDELAAKWKGGRFPLLNKANLLLAKNGAYGTEAATIAQQLDGQITDLTSELANVYMGGNSPTDHALKLGEANLKGNWSEPVLKAMTAQSRRNLKIRLTAMDTIAAAGVEPVTPSGADPNDPLGILKK